jgi:hypothetical protein
MDVADRQPAGCTRGAKTDNNMSMTLSYPEARATAFLQSLKRRNQLKSHVSDEKFQENPSESKPQFSAKAQGKRRAPRDSKFPGLSTVLEFQWRGFLIS